jgi:hypothetical protein
MFMVTSLALSMLRPHESSILDRVNGPSATPAPAASVAIPLGKGASPAAAAPATSAPAAAAPAGTATAAPAVAGQPAAGPAAAPAKPAASPR